MSEISDFFQSDVGNDGSQNPSDKVDNGEERKEISAEYYYRLTKDACIPGLFVFLMIVFWTVFKLNFFLNVFLSYVFAMVIYIIWSGLVHWFIVLRTRK